MFVSPLDLSNCNADVVAPTSAVMPISNASFLQNGHTYYVTLRATSGAGVTGLSPSAPFVYINSLPAVGAVFETYVGAGVVTGVLDVANDIDFQSDTCCLLVQWTHFVHAYDQGGVTYSVALLYDGQVYLSLSLVLVHALYDECT
jgi:hypothetical protein